MKNYLSTFVFSISAMYTNYTCVKDNQNYNKILELDWLSSSLI